MASDDVSTHITGFIRDQFLDGDPGDELDERTPLLDWGVMTSRNIAMLLGFIRTELGVHVPPTEINQRNFKDIRSISALVTELAGT